MKKCENIVDTAFHSLATSKVKGSIACRLSSNLYYCKNVRTLYTNSVIVKVEARVGTYKVTVFK